MRVVSKRRGLDAQPTLAAILRIASLVYGRKFSVCFVKWVSLSRKLPCELLDLMPYEKQKRESCDSLFCFLVRTTGLELCTADTRFARLRQEVFGLFCEMG